MIHCQITWHELVLPQLTIVLTQSLYSVQWTVRLVAPFAFILAPLHDSEAPGVDADPVAPTSTSHE